MLIAVFLISSLFAGQGYTVNGLVWEIMQGVNDFGCQLYQNVTKEPGSFVSSPLSADLALAMLMVGAGNEMFQKMASVLHVQGNRTHIEDGYRDLSNATLTRKRNVTLEIANKLYVSDDGKVKPEYQQAVKNIFHSEVEPMNMKNKDAALANVNKWVTSATHGKIDKILDDLPNDTIAIGLNAVYFYGQWKKQFNPNNTREEKFHLNSTSSKSIPMMSMTSNDLLLEAYPEFDFDALKLYYTGEDTSMLILLPREIDGLAALEAKFPTLNITSISQSFARGTVDVLLPKFKIESKMELSEPLKKMGLDSMFDYSMNFSSITSKEFKISSITQKAFIEVSEEGTEATAVTGWEAVQTSDSTRLFRADHPFMFIIRDELTGAFLFMGRFTGQ